MITNHWREIFDPAAQIFLNFTVNSLLPFPTHKIPKIAPIHPLSPTLC